MNIKGIFTFILLLFSCNCYTQDNNIDSLLGALKAAKEDTNKVLLLRDIGVVYANEDPSTAIAYWKKGIILSHKLNYIAGLARSFINVSIGFSYMAKLDSCIIYGDSAIYYSKLNGNPDRIALAYLNKGDAYRNIGDLTAAMLYCDTASLYAEKTSNTDRQARIYDIIADIYFEQQRYKESLDISSKALSLYKKDDNLYMVGQSYDDYGFIYQRLGKHDSALMYRKMAIEIAEDIKDYKNLSGYYYALATSYIDKNDYRQAAFFANKSLEFAKQQESNVQLATSHTLLAKIYLTQGHYNNAIKEGKAAYDFAVAEVKINWQNEAAIVLAEAYEKTGDYKSAYHYAALSRLLSDSLAKETFNAEVSALQSSFEVKEKDKTIQLLNKEKELQDQRIKQQKYIAAGSITIALLVLAGVVLLISRIRLKQRMSELELRSKIASDLHDDVGSTLSSIRMYSDIVKSQVNQTPVAAELLDKISSNSKEMIETMSDIVWMIKPGNDDFNSVQNRMINFANELCIPAGINFEFNCDESIDVLRIGMELRRDIYLIFKEAINNAVKYADCKNIHVSINVADDQLHMRISDDGKGFEVVSAKNGNGLSNMRKRVEIHRGNFSVKSFSNEGTEIIASLPLQ